jgi:hypothetical protein
MTVASTDRISTSTCYYLVLQTCGTWWVEREGRSLGPCQTIDEAINSALSVVELFGDPHRPAQVWAPGQSGKMELVWKRAAAPEPTSELG